ncbi:MAG: thiamine pyrophosphate-dependent enzyme [Myxococcota bacterium]
MAVSRAAAVDEQLLSFIASRPAARLHKSPSDRLVESDPLRVCDAVRLFEAQIQSRLLDLTARELKARGESFYTIGSSGHEGNAAVAEFIEPGDQCFLHYRSGAFFCALADRMPGPEGAFDVLLGLAASSDEPIAGGRHKVFGSVTLGIPPQTSTIASHLPKAVGAAIAIDRRAHLKGETSRAIAVASFGDASLNHASSQTALNAAAWATFQRVPCPCLFVCEDNGFGISVRTPKGWVDASTGGRPGLRTFTANGLDLLEAVRVAREAVAYVREERKPAVLHLRVVRLLGHAGSDVEQLYRSRSEIEATEAQDPLQRTVSSLVEHGAMTPEAIRSVVDAHRARIAALAEEAIQRPKLETRAAVMAPLAPHDADRVANTARAQVADEARRHDVFGETLPEDEERPRHLAVQLNRALTDLLLACDEAIVFGEDVAKKGGVYHVTASLAERFGVGRVFNTMLDETSILGLAIGAGHQGLLPIPEIQYLAYLMNAIDQLRGEAGSMQFFSNGQFQNPMVVRVAGLAYQRGFGGHFHNDNGIAALREIPGVLLGCPARPDDGVKMLRTMAAAATAHGRLAVLLEPIALYMTRDLYKPGDGKWMAHYPAPGESLAIDEVGVVGDGEDLLIVSYANGFYQSLRVAQRLEQDGIRVRVVDVRWLQPLPIAAVVEHARATGRMLVVDECRASSGIADTLVAEVVEATEGRVRTARVTGADSYIPLGAAANLVLVQEEQVEAAARKLVEARRVEVA